MTTVSKRRAEKTDEIHSRLKTVVEVPVTQYLWVPADAITFSPRLCSTIYGDGRALFTITTINNRPAFWVIRGDSTWDCQESRAPADAPYFGDFTDDIMTELEDEFGNARCGYSGANLYHPRDERGCDCEECSDPEVACWPMVDADCGCSWGRMDWPKSFATVEHPWSPFGNLLSPDPMGGSHG